MYVEGGRGEGMYVEGGQGGGCICGGEEAGVWGCGGCLCDMCRWLLCVCVCVRRWLPSCVSVCTVAAQHRNPSVWESEEGRTTVNTAPSEVRSCSEKSQELPRGKAELELWV